MRISDWSSDVCSSDLSADDRERLQKAMMDLYKKEGFNPLAGCWPMLVQFPVFISLYWVLLESVEIRQAPFMRSEEHTSELQSLMRISYAVFCLKKKNEQLKTHRDSSENTRTHQEHRCS